MRIDWKYLRVFIFAQAIFILLAASIAQSAIAKEIKCTLKLSATAEYSDNKKIKVGTTDNDNIPIIVSNVGEKMAIANGKYQLHLLKKDTASYYYVEDLPLGLVIWSYNWELNILTYSKIRDFISLENNGTPSSYIMMAKCD